MLGTLAICTFVRLLLSLPHLDVLFDNNRYLANIVPPGDATSIPKIRRLYSGLRRSKVHISLHLLLLSG